MTTREPAAASPPPAARPPYQRAICLRCGFTVCLTDESGEPVPHLEQLYTEHVLDCPTRRPQEEVKREREALRSAEFLREHRGERAAERIEREMREAGA